jgi:hypothetical protein
MINLSNLDKDIFYKEREILRNELDSLKNCQLTYFTTSVTATALMLTIAGNFSGSDFSGIVYPFLY